jgi:hypothetical protein
MQGKSAVLWGVAGAGLLLGAGAPNGSPGMEPGVLSGLYYGVALPVLLLFMVLIARYFIVRFGHGRNNWTGEDFIQHLEESGLLVDEQYRATRAFAVEEFEDEGSAYFVELEDGRVLFLMGQYLYDYEPIEDDPELNQPRIFPCTEFTLRRHREEGYVADLVCTGEPFEPEVTVAPFGEEIYEKGGVPEDGEIVEGRSYEELKRVHMARRA